MRSRARRGREFRRARPIREAFDLVLIVCEGEKTEPKYFKSLCRSLRLSTANVVVAGPECGSSPQSVVEYAVDQFKRRRDFDRVYCVFDRDQHPSFDAAVDRCRQLHLVNNSSKRCQFYAITSSPSFEYWIYLHFVESDAPVAAAGNKSSGDIMMSLLAEHMPSYRKAADEVFEKLKPELGEASRRAKRINERGYDNPHTKVVDLVQYLLRFRESSPEFPWVKTSLI